MKAVWNNTVIAESDSTIVIEGNHYFPPESIKKEFFDESSTEHEMWLERNCKLLFHQN